MCARHDRFHPARKGGSGPPADNNVTVSSLGACGWPQTAAGILQDLVGESYRRQGFSVKETGNAGADGGVDLELRKGRELHLVQCKHWKALRVGVDVVRKLYGAMAARGAASGYVVTSGSFTDAAHEFAKGGMCRPPTERTRRQDRHRPLSCAW